MVLVVAVVPRGAGIDAGGLVKVLGRAIVAPGQQNESSCERDKDFAHQLSTVGLVHVAASGSSKAQDSQTCVAGSAQVVASHEALSTHMPSTLRYSRLLAEVKPHEVA